MSERVSDRQTKAGQNVTRLILSANRVEAATVVEIVAVEAEVVGDPTQMGEANHRKRSRGKPSWIWDALWIRRSGSSFRVEGR